MSSVDRGQFIVITGLVLAILLVGLALVLNSVIFAGNVASRETNPEAGAAADQRAALDEAVGRAIHHVNVHDPTAPNENLTQEVAAINDQLRRQAMHGELVAVEVGDQTNGTRIAQTNTSRDFTAGGANAGTADWTIIEGTEGTQQFDLLVNSSSLYNADEGTTWQNITDNAFRITLTDETATTWHLYLYRSSITGNAYLASEGPPGSGLADDDSVFTTLDQACVASGSNVTIEALQGLFGSERQVHATTDGITTKPDPRDGTRRTCSELGFYDATANYTVSYANADAAAGRYELLTAAPNATVDKTSYHDASDTMSPYAHEAIWGANLSMHYETGDVTYQVNWSTSAQFDRIHLGEQPTIDRFNVTDESAKASELEILEEDRVQYDVEWAVSDASGDLANGTVYLYNTDENRTEDSAPISVAGESADGTLTVQGTNESYGDEYVLRIEVEDGGDQADSESVTDVADGD